MSDKNEIDRVRAKVVHSNDLSNTHLPLTTTSSNVFAFILASLKENQYEYTYSIRTLMETIGVSDYRILTNAFTQLRKTTIYINLKDKNKKDMIKDTGLILHSMYPKNENDDTKINGYVTIKLDEHLTPHLFSLTENFTVYQLKYYLALKKLNSKRLYVFLASYKHKKSVVISGSELQYLLGTHYKELRVLYNKEIKECIKEIELTTNINNITIEPIKQSRTIVSFRIHFDWVNGQLEFSYPTAYTTQKELELHNRLVMDFNLTNNQAKTIIQHVPLKKIYKVLKDVTILKNDNKIQSVVPYLLAIFRNTYELEEYI